MNKPYSKKILNEIFKWIMDEISKGNIFEAKSVRIERIFIRESIKKFNRKWRVKI